MNLEEVLTHIQESETITIGCGLKSLFTGVKRGLNGNIPEKYFQYKVYQLAVVYKHCKYSHIAIILSPPGYYEL